jgi:hypothetical protein
MKYYPLPVAQNHPWFTFRIPLSSVTYSIEMRYNTRMGRWIFSLGDAIGTPIVVGIPIFPNRDLLSRYQGSAIPPGPLFCIDDTGQNTPPTLSSFLTDHRLIYGDPTA